MNGFVAVPQQASFFLSGPAAAVAALWAQWAQPALMAVLVGRWQWFSLVALLLFNVTQALRQAAYVHRPAFTFLLLS